MSFTRHFTSKISHEAEIVFSGPMIDQFTFLDYSFSIFHQRTVLLSARRLASLRFPNSDLLLKVQRKLLTLACGLITRANIIELTELIR